MLRPALRPVMDVDGARASLKDLKALHAQELLQEQILELLCLAGLACSAWQLFGLRQPLGFPGTSSRDHTEPLRGHACLLALL